MKPDFKLTQTDTPRIWELQNESRESRLNAVMTIEEIEETYDLETGAVEDYLSQFPDIPIGRKSGKTILLLRAEAEMIWGA